MDNTPDILVLKFADSKIPVFKEDKRNDYIRYGEDNKYPEYLTRLFNKSAKHNAILSGKAHYIFGKGFPNGDAVINRLGESLNDISKKAILDIEIYGGFRLEVVWNRGGKVGEVYHVDYSTLRVGKETGFYFKETWDVYDREDPRPIPSFNPGNPVGSQIYSYNEYRPGVRFYPLPEYIGCNNYVETDIEISKFYLSSIRNGMMPSKMIQFFKGEPTEDKKREIEARFSKKFAGSENAGRFLLVFNDNNQSTGVKIDDLSANELDKMFIELNKTVQQEVFSGHKVTSPMLFGIKTEGQLGGNTELQTAYNIFQNTYSTPKAEAFSNEVEYLMGYSTMPGEYELQPTDPIGWIIPDSVLSQAITPDEAREKLGLEVIEKPTDSPATKTLNALSGVSPLVATKILDNLTQNEIRSLAALPPIANGDVVPGVDVAPISAPEMDNDAANVPSNANIRNLTAKQHQQVMRIIRQYSQGKLTELAAKAMLRTGYGLDENDINDLLGIKAPAQLSAQDVDSIIQMFDACGDARIDYEILKSKKVAFTEDEAADDELIFIQEAFKDYDVTTTEKAILELIKKDKRITSKVIADTIGQTPAYVEAKINTLIKRGYIETSIGHIGVDEIIERVIPDSIDITMPPSVGKNNPSQIFIKYSYEGPQDSRNRPFCAKLMQLDRLYSRAEIEKISERLGYSVFDRRGGFWMHKDGTVTPYCRHKWKSNIVVKKK